MRQCAAPVPVHANPLLSRNPYAQGMEVLAPPCGCRVPLCRVGKPPALQPPDEENAIAVQPPMRMAEIWLMEGEFVVWP